jgi:Lipopolysaccharide-assembly
MREEGSGCEERNEIVRPANQHLRFLRAAGRAAAAALLGSACYGFAGGGLPPEVRTVAILPFDNLTGDPALTQEVQTAVRTAFEDRLGLRAAGEDRADAVVRGSITSYETDVPLSFQQTQPGTVTVTRRMVQLVVSVEIYNRIEDQTIWQRSGLRVEGEYDPPNEKQGRALALDQLVSDLVDGAQSQW